MIFLPGNVRRASTYAAGTPISTEITTTSSEIRRVTPTTLNSPNSCQAALYQLAGKPSGSQVPNHLVPNELTSTEPTTPNRFIRKNATTAQISQAPGLATSRRRGRAGTGVVVAISPCLRSSPRRAASATEHQPDDDQLDGAHHHRDRRCERVVVHLVGGLVGGQREHPSLTRRVADQHRRREHAETQHERQAEGGGQPRREQRQGDPAEPLLPVGAERRGGLLQRRIDTREVGQDEQERERETGDDQ